MDEHGNENFQYLYNKRYLVEIKDRESERIYYTRRIGTLAKAVRIAGEYNLLKDLTAKILDTKTGEII